MIMCSNAQRLYKRPWVQKVSPVSCCNDAYRGWTGLATSVGLREFFVGYSS